MSSCVEKPHTWPHIYTCMWDPRIALGAMPGATVDGVCFRLYFVCEHDKFTGNTSKQTATYLRIFQRMSGGVDKKTSTNK